MEKILRFFHEKTAEDMIEYALLAGFLSIVAIIALQLMGVPVKEIYYTLQDAVRRANMTGGGTGGGHGGGTPTTNWWF